MDVLREEQAGKAGGVHQENAQCHATTSELGHPKEDDGGGGGTSFCPREEIRSARTFTNEGPGKTSTGLVS